MVDRFQGYLVKMGEEEAERAKAQAEREAAAARGETTVAEVAIFYVTCLVVVIVVETDLVRPPYVKLGDWEKVAQTQMPWL